MHKFAIAVAIIAFGAFVATIPANADSHFGPTQQNGQCWKEQVGYKGNGAGTFGYWSACAQSASIPVTPAPRGRRTRHVSR
jgi:hypothetical protein